MDAGWILYDSQPVFLAVHSNVNDIEIPLGLIRFVGLDVTDVLSVGMKIRFTNDSNTIYGEITGVDLVDGHTDVTYRREPNVAQLVDSEITGFAYSVAEAPYKYPSIRWTDCAKFKVHCPNPAPTADDEVIKYSVVLDDPAGNYDTDNKRYYFPVKGIYRVSMQIAVQVPTSGQRYGMRMRPNGSTLSSNTRMFTTFGDAACDENIVTTSRTYYTNTSFDVEYDAGEWADVQARFPDNETKNISPTAAQAFWQCSLIKPL